MPFISLPSKAVVGATLGRIIRSPWLWAGLLLVGVTLGTWWYLKDDKADAVIDAETRGASQANEQANQETRDIEDQLQEATDKIMSDNARLREQAAKDFERVRNRIETAPREQREAGVPPLIIDTLNELDSLREDRDRNADAVRDAEVTAG